MAVADRARNNGHLADDGRAAENGRRSSRSLLGRAVREVTEQARRRIPRADLDERDPDFIRERLPLMWLMASL
jgi:hypothetical protein